MASFTIRNLDESLKKRLHVRAASNGRSMEKEALDILRVALSRVRTPPTNLAAAIRARFAEIGGVDLDQAPRGPMRRPPEFET